MLIRLALAFALLVPPAAAQQRPAPLPPYWSNAHSKEDAADYRPPAALRGIAAHGFSGGDLMGNGSEAVCKGSDAEQRGLVERVPHPTEFWFYATGAQAVLFRRTLSIAPDQPCATAASWHYDIARAFVADGLIHSFAVNVDNTLEDGETRPADKSNGVYSGAFSPIANLMARTGLPTGKLAKDERMLGLAVRCGGMSGLIWHRTCVVAQGKLRGMIVYGAAGDDEQEMFHLEFDRLDPDARLDGKLFEIDREWDSAD
ncbi:hypothetical protein HZY97_12300 [Sphingomonas sp. R-74633]|uniref:hypothetical protein n=1 Tax=Sphingomonas sp. R-74633 TaxID=2751188 RepID=UPI0015D14E55|nr:hypothetical protein [Sphingomonas sp. R-74633]NYT41544.1 hypothetical protein [Sphingomonas sp. R-74633]